MTIELPKELEAALKRKATDSGVSPAAYICEILQRDLAPALESQSSAGPLKTGYGMLAKYGPAPTEEEIDANRADMFGTFGERL